MARSGRIAFHRPEAYQGFTPPPALEPIPTKKGTKCYVHLSSIINWLMTGKLLPYEHNRGKCLVALKTVKSILSKGIISDVLGEMTIGYRDVTDENGVVRKRLSLADWHGRGHAAIQRFMDGDMLDGELDILVSCSVAEDFLRAYINLNMGNVHNSGDRNDNPDLTYGILGLNVFPELSPNCLQAVSSKFSMLGYIAYAMTQIPQDSPDWTFPNVYACRNQATKLQNMGLGTIRLTKAQFSRFADAIEDWYEFCSDYVEAAPLPVEGVTNTTGFFGYFVVHRLAEPKGLDFNPNVMVKRAITHSARLLADARKLMHGKRGEIQERTRIFDEIFSGKKRGAPRKSKVFVH